MHFFDIFLSMIISVCLGSRRFILEISDSRLCVDDPKLCNPQLKHMICPYPIFSRYCHRLCGKCKPETKSTTLTTLPMSTTILKSSNEPEKLTSPKTQSTSTTTALPTTYFKSSTRKETPISQTTQTSTTMPSSTTYLKLTEKNISTSPASKSMTTRPISTPYLKFSAQNKRSTSPTTQWTSIQNRTKFTSMLPSLSPSQTATVTTIQTTTKTDATSTGCMGLPKDFPPGCPTFDENWCPICDYKLCTEK